jgi:transcriptional regulator with XRE-family HTH domain
VTPAALLRDARRRSGLTLRQLARRARTSHSAIAAYESGAKSPNSATLRRLVRACGFEIEPQLRPLAPFEDRSQRGRDLIEVLDLAGEFPSAHRALSRRRFPVS